MSKQAGNKAEPGKCGHVGWQKDCHFSGSKKTDTENKSLSAVEL